MAGKTTLNIPLNIPQNFSANKRVSTRRDDAAPAGFISAFQFSGGEALRLLWDEARAAIAQEAPTWLHLSANDDTVEGWLEGVSSMPDAAREFLNGEDKRPRVHIGGNFMYGVVADLELVAKTSADALLGVRDRRAAFLRRPASHDHRAREAAAIDRPAASRRARRHDVPRYR